MKKFLVMAVVVVNVLFGLGSTVCAETGTEVRVLGGSATSTKSGRTYGEETVLASFSLSSFSAFEAEVSNGTHGPYSYNALRTGVVLKDYDWPVDGRVGFSFYEDHRPRIYVGAGAELVVFPFFLGDTSVVLENHFEPAGEAHLLRAEISIDVRNDYSRFFANPSVEYRHRWDYGNMNRYRFKPLIGYKFTDNVAGLVGAGLEYVTGPNYFNRWAKVNAGLQLEY